MSPLDPETLREVVTLLRPLMSSERERRALLTHALYGCPALQQIHYSGSVDAFLVNAVQALCDYGEVEPGRPALRVLLETAREQVGSDRQWRIDVVIRAVFGDAPALPHPEAPAEARWLPGDAVPRLRPRRAPSPGTSCSWCMGSGPRRSGRGWSPTSSSKKGR
jgi:Effector-associated domain 8